MNVYFIPTDPEFVEHVAKAIARNRMHQDAAGAITNLIGKQISLEETSFEKTLDNIFDRLWNGKSDNDQAQRDNYMNDALAAISAINLKLIASIE